MAICWTITAHIFATDLIFLEDTIVHHTTLVTVDPELGAGCQTFRFSAVANLTENTISIIDVFAESNWKLWKALWTITSKFFTCHCIRITTRGWRTSGLPIRNVITHITALSDLKAGIGLRLVFTIFCCSFFSSLFRFFNCVSFFFSSISFFLFYLLCFLFSFNSSASIFFLLSSLSIPTYSSDVRFLAPVISFVYFFVMA